MSLGNAVRHYEARGLSWLSIHTNISDFSNLFPLFFGLEEGSINFTSLLFNPKYFAVRHIYGLLCSPLRFFG